jgi:hypothetical protein
MTLFANHRRNAIKFYLVSFFFLPSPNIITLFSIVGNKIERSCGPLEQQTIQKLSFDCPDYSKFEPAQTCRPVASYQKPTEPMEMRTTQKLSYTPVFPLPKEILPWAVRPKYLKPDVRMECGTTYTHSFLANCEDFRSAKVMPTCNPQLITTSRYFDANTVYKNSFLPGSSKRPDAIRPRAQLQLPDCYKQDGDTVYKVNGFISFKRSFT